MEAENVDIYWRLLKPGIYREASSENLHLADAHIAFKTWGIWQTGL
ncbi:hypothetical protein ACFOGG_17505 [Brenneria rubrifaciens]